MNFIAIVILLISLGNFAASQYRGSSCDLKNGQSGTCKPARECAWLEKQLSEKRIDKQNLKDLRCSFENNIEIICCGDDVETPAPPTSTELPSRLGERSSEIACDSYTKNRLQILPFIINGEKADDGEFPHMAALGYPGAKSPDEIEFRCGGSLISDRFILTAAHCANIQVPKPVLARLGTIDVNNTNNEATDVAIESIILHPMYVSNRQYHDIALIRLAEVVSISMYISPACLRTTTEDPPFDQQMVITGWGIIDTKRQITSDLLLKANVTLYDFQTCREKFPATLHRRKLPNGLISGQICAYDKIKSSDSCQGDSGGPLQIIHPERRAIEIVGVVSIGISCGAEVPGVYTKVAEYIGWIEKEVWGT